MTATDEPGAFAWGPDRRPSPSATGFLAGLIVVALAAGVIAVAVHKNKAPAESSTAPAITPSSKTPRSTTTAAPQATTTTTLATPAGFERLLDETDHLSLAVPPGWQAPRVSNGTLANDLTAMKAKDPTMAPLLDNALAALGHIQVGVFAVDATTKSTMYAYGIDLPGVASANQISPADVVKGIQAAGGKNVKYTPIQLPVGPAGQITAQLIVNQVTISEALDYFVVKGRLISLVVATRGTKAPLAVLRQIEPSLAPA